MVNFSTSSDLFRSNTKKTEEDGAPEYSYALTENLAFFKDVLDSLIDEPRQECVDTIMTYSRTLSRQAENTQKETRK